MPYADADNVVVSPAWIWRAPTNVATFPDPNDTTVGDTTVWTNWTPIGYTLAPLTINRSAEEFGVDVQQSTVDVRRTLTGEEFTLSSEMAEISAANLALLLQGSVTTTAAGAAQVGYDQVDFGGSTTLVEYAWGVEWITVLADGTELASRLILYKGTVTMDGDMTLGEGEAASIPFSVTAVADSTQDAGEQIGYFQIATANITA